MTKPRSSKKSLFLGGVIGFILCFILSWPLVFENVGIRGSQNRIVANLWRMERTWSKPIKAEGVSSWLAQEPDDVYDGYEGPAFHRPVVYDASVEYTWRYVCGIGGRVFIHFDENNKYLGFIEYNEL